MKWLMTILILLTLISCGREYRINLDPDICDPMVLLDTLESLEAYDFWDEELEQCAGASTIYDGSSFAIVKVFQYSFFNTEMTALIDHYGITVYYEYDDDGIIQEPYIQQVYHFHQDL